MRTMLAGLAVLVAVAARGAWFDFAQRGGSNDWNATQGDATLAWMAPAGGATGSVLRFSGPKGGFAYTHRDLLPPDLPACDAVAFRVRLAKPPPGGAEPDCFEVQFIEPDGRSKFWRKVVAASTNWNEVRLPLRFFRTNGTRLPRWDGIRFLGLYLRTSADVLIDGIDFTRTAGLDSRMAPKELRAIAFPDAPEGTVRLAQKPGVIVLTDCPKIEVKQLADRLDTLAAELQDAFIFAPPAKEPPSLVVFDTKEAYETFPLRMAARMDSAAERPESGGLTIQSIATSSYDASFGTLRPVYFHEFAHAWLGRRLRMEDDGGWFQEGVANHFQIKLFPQADMAKIVNLGIGDPSYRLPLRELCSGKRIPLNRYWQAMTVIGLLLNEDPYRGSLEQMVNAFHAAGSTDLDKVLGPVFGTDWDGFAAAWMNYCRKTWPASKPDAAP